MLAIGAAAVALALVVTDAWPALRGPAPYPPEWQWPRRENAVASPLPAVATAGLVLGLIALTGTAAARRARAAGPAVAAAIALGFAFQLAVLALEPEGAMTALMNQTVYRTATSYLTVAASDAASDSRGFVQRHHELLPDLRKTGKHASTHPPGPVLLFRGLIAAFERAPALTRAVLRAGGFEEVNTRRPRPRHPPPVRAAALAGGLLIALCGAATAWPIAALARRAAAEPPAAARVAALWAVMPGPALMTPMLDQALCLPVAAATACLARAALGAGAAWPAAALGGVLGGLAALLSYGAPVFLAFGGLAVLALAWDSPQARRRAALAAAVAAGVAAAVWLLPALAGHRPFASLATALAIHRDEYTRPRGYSLWLGFNVLDLAMFAGVPLAAAWLARVVHVFRRGTREPGDRMALATAIALLVVLLSGQTRGEVGRIWLPLMPVLLVAALARRDGPGRAESLVYGAALAALTIAMALSWQVP